MNDLLPKTLSVRLTEEDVQRVLEHAAAAQYQGYDVEVIVSTYGAYTINLNKKPDEHEDLAKIVQEFAKNKPVIPQPARVSF